MSQRIASLAAVVLTAALSACASTKNEDAKSEDVKSEGVKIYSPAQLEQGSYETLGRIWVGSWRTALWVPTYSSRDDGIAALKDKAAALDANGLINADCYGDRGLFGGSATFTCYGKAIRVR